MNQEYLIRDIGKVENILDGKHEKTNNCKYTFIKKYTPNSDKSITVTTTWNLSLNEIVSLIDATENKWKPTSMIESPQEVVHRIMMKGKTIITPIKNYEGLK